MAQEKKEAATKKGKKEAPATAGVSGKKEPVKAKGELVKEPDSDAMKAARKLVDIRNSIDENKDKLESASRELIQLMEKENRSRLFVDGFTITVKFKEAQKKVNVTKPRF